MYEWNAVGHTREQKPKYVRIRNIANQERRAHKKLQPSLVFWIFDKVVVCLNNKTTIGLSEGWGKTTDTYLRGGDPVYSHGEKAPDETRT